MTILQLRVAVATADLKSVSAAAKMLNTSQPNASNSLKLLEEEIGFPIFVRTTAGATATSKGLQFLEYARQILDTNERVMTLRNTEEIYQLRLGTVNYYTAAEPFYVLCAEHRDDAKTDFQYQSVSIAGGIQELAAHNLDVVVIAVMKHQISGLYRECEKVGIEMNTVCQVPAIVMVRKDHPAALDGRLENVTQGSGVMKDYPYIGYRNFALDTGSTSYDDSDFIQCSYKIFVDDTNVRLRVIEATNGFGFGILSSYRMMSKFALSSFPVPGMALELMCLNRAGESGRREIRDYLRQLKKEMQKLVPELRTEDSDAE